MAVGYGHWLIVLTKVGEEWSAMVFGPDGRVGGPYGTGNVGSDLSSVMGSAKSFIDKQPTPQNTTVESGETWKIDLVESENGWKATIMQMSDPALKEVRSGELTIEDAINDIENYLSVVPKTGFGRG